MALTSRQKLFFFVGLNIALYGLSLTILGAWLQKAPILHGAAGATMWCGIILIMCGVGNVIISIDSTDSKDDVGGISLSAMLANIVGMLIGIVVIAFATWASWEVLDGGAIYGKTESAIEIYVTVVLLGGFSMIFSLVALMFDCCCVMTGFKNAQPAMPQQMGGYPQGYF